MKITMKNVNRNVPKNDFTIYWYSFFKRNSDLKVQRYEILCHVVTFCKIRRNRGVNGLMDALTFGHFDP